MTKTEERKLLNTVARHEFQNELKHLRTRQGRFDAAMLHLDHPIPGTDLYLTPSDHGAGAERVRDEVEATVDGEKSTPFWLRLWRRRRLALNPRRRTILDALAVDWRSRPAARIAEVSQPTVDASKKNLQNAFRPMPYGVETQICELRTFRFFAKCCYGTWGGIRRGGSRACEASR